MPMDDKERAAFVAAIREAPMIEVDVNPMTGAAVAPFPEWLFQAGVEFGRASVLTVIDADEYEAARKDPRVHKVLADAERAYEQRQEI